MYSSKAVLRSGTSISFVTLIEVGTTAIIVSALVSIKFGGTKKSHSNSWSIFQTDRSVSSHPQKILGCREHEITIKGKITLN